MSGMNPRMSLILVLFVGPTIIRRIFLLNFVRGHPLYLFKAVT